MERALSADLRKSRRQAFIKGYLIAFLSMVFLISVYSGYHWFSSVKGSDFDELAEQVAEYTHAEKIFVAKTEQRENYLAALCADNKNNWYICIFDRDKIFKDRWTVNGGTPGFASGDVAGWNFRYLEDSIFVFGGANLSNCASSYTFENNGLEFTCPIKNNTVLDIFVLPGGNYMNSTEMSL